MTTVPTREHQRQSGSSKQGMMISVRLLIPFSMLVGIPLLATSPAQAQTEGWLLGPSSGVGKQSVIVPTNCLTSPDGSISCDTKVVNPASDTPARPYYNPFKD